MFNAFILAAIGAGLCLLLASLMKRLLWPVLTATLVVGAGLVAYAWVLVGNIIIRWLWVGLFLIFTYPASGAAIAALATGWVRRRRIRMGETVEEIEQRERTRKKARHIVLLACLTAVLVLIVGFVAFRIILSKRVNRELDEMRARGFPVTLEELNAWYPQPPAGQNAAEVYQKAFALYADEKGKYENLPTIFSYDFKLPPIGDPLPPEMKRLVETYVADNREALKLLHQAAAMPLCRFPVDFTKAFQGPAPRLGILGWQGSSDPTYWTGLHKAVFRLLASEALVHADNGRAPEAAVAVADMIGAGESLGHEPLMQAQGMRAIFPVAGIYCLQRVLSRTVLSEEDLGRIDDLLKDAVNLDGMTRAIAVARCMGSAAFTNRKAGAALAETLDAYFLYTYAHQNDPTEFDAGIPVMKPVTMPLISWRLRCLGLLDLDHLHFLMWTKTFLADWQERECKGGLFDVSQRSKPSPFPYGPVQALCCGFSFNFLLAWPSYNSNFVMLISQVELARAAIAVERYRNAQDGLPEKLADLVPAWLPAVPLDPWDMKPLRYKKLDKGYVIYSVGSDRKDEGGSADPERDFKKITFRVAR